jgi:NO-binding membrane sensor protein with MHYT domain
MAHHHHNLALVVLSVVIAIFASYTAMGGMTFLPTEGSPLLAEQLLATNGLAAAVIVGTLVILGIAGRSYCLMKQLF